MEIEFQKMLNIIAELCNYQLTESVIEIYDKAISPFGYEKAVQALKDIAGNLRGGDKFPSVNDIRDRASDEISPKSRAIVASNMIIATFYGWKLDFIFLEDFQTKYKQMVGELEWETVSLMGGYRHLFKEFNEAKELSFLRSQIRDAAFSVIEKRNKTRQVLESNTKKIEAK